MPAESGIPLFGAPPPRAERDEREASRPFLRFDHLTKRFGATVAVDDVSLEIGRGAFFALLGPSGCGKTTLLRMLAGFERPDRGRILIDGADVADVPPYRRPTNMMFQSYALFPHMSVAENVGFGLKQSRQPRGRIAARVAEMLELVQLRGFEARRPDQLSGGERQRVALARALANAPQLLLLDEPLAALDRKLREETRLELVRIQHRVGITFLIVTHDQEEAMTMASRMAVMSRGRVMQVGTPAEIYETPNSRFVADFIGAVNLFDGRVAGGDGTQLKVDCAELGVTLSVAGPTLAPGSSVAIAVRPEKIALSAPDHAQGGNRILGVVREIAYRGEASTFRVALQSGALVRVTLSNHRRGGATLPVGSAVAMSWSSDAGVVLTR